MRRAGGTLAAAGVVATLAGGGLAYAQEPTEPASTTTAPAETTPVGPTGPTGTTDGGSETGVMVVGGAPKPAGEDPGDKRAERRRRARQIAKDAREADSKRQAAKDKKAKDKGTDAPAPGGGALVGGGSLALPPGLEVGARVPNLLLEKFRIPPFLLPIYQAAGVQYGVRWEVLAAINEIETDYGRNLNVSSAGAQGWMQFMPATWAQWGVDANRDGRRDPYNPVDAIFAAARYLAAADYEHDVRGAIFAYNHADWYVNSVLLRARLVETLPGPLVDALTGLTEGRFPVAATSSYASGVTDAKAKARAGSRALPVQGNATRTDLVIRARAGSPVVAVQDGEVVKTGTSSTLGHYVVLRDVWGNSYTYAGLGAVAPTYLAPKESETELKLRQESSDADDPKPTIPATAGTQPADSAAGTTGAAAAALEAPAKTLDPPADAASSTAGAAAQSATAAAASAAPGAAAGSATAGAAAGSAASSVPAASATAGAAAGSATAGAAAGSAASSVPAASATAGAPPASTTSRVPAPAGSAAPGAAALPAAPAGGAASASVPSPAGTAGLPAAAGTTAPSGLAALVPGATVVGGAISSPVPGLDGVAGVPGEPIRTPGAVGPRPAAQEPQVVDPSAPWVVGRIVAGAATPPAPVDTSSPAAGLQGPSAIGTPAQSELRLNQVAATQAGATPPPAPAGPTGRSVGRGGDDTLQHSRWTADQLAAAQEAALQRALVAATGSPTGTTDAAGLGTTDAAGLGTTGPAAVGTTGPAADPAAAAPAGLDGPAGVPATTDPAAASAGADATPPVGATASAAAGSLPATAVPGSPAAAAVAPAAGAAGSPSTAAAPGSPAALAAGAAGSLPGAAPTASAEGEGAADPLPLPLPAPAAAGPSEGATSAQSASTTIEPADGGDPDGVSVPLAPDAVIPAGLGGPVAVPAPAPTAELPAAPLVAGALGALPEAAATPETVAPAAAAAPVTIAPDPVAAKLHAEEPLVAKASATGGSPVTTYTPYARKVLNGLARKHVESRPLKVGAQVVGGTVLGKLGEAPAAGEQAAMRFRIRPAGKGAPLIDPTPIVDGWRLLETSSVYRASGKSALTGGPLTIGRLLLQSKSQLARLVLESPDIEIYPCGRQDIQAGRIDRRVLATLAFLAASGLKPTVSALECGHSFLTSSGNVSEHSSGSAVDIAAINGIPILGHQGAGSITETTIRKLLTLQGVMKPHQIISLMTFPGTDNTLSLPDHDDHIHVGFHAGPTLGGPTKTVLKPDQWARFVAQLDGLQLPEVAAAPSSASLPADK